ncbi:hypothetical protein QBC47DRAFT_394054 [Echria macrotheca]|uniref:Uncharacterized protein n=1 Tax=Echria macrotheca TaxID=438768 RepID=A0AAJ0B2I7_9PEZI|nr:hypothetical protein QBC47DRAFT_394054 [Echria macrotheca]
MEISAHQRRKGKSLWKEAKRVCKTWNWHAVRPDGIPQIGLWMRLDSMLARPGKQLRDATTKEPVAPSGFDAPISRKIVPPLVGRRRAARSRAVLASKHSGQIICSKPEETKFLSTPSRTPAYSASSPSQVRRVDIVRGSILAKLLPKYGAIVFKAPNTRGPAKLVQEQRCEASGRNPLLTRTGTEGTTPGFATHVCLEMRPRQNTPWTCFLSWQR